MEKLKQATESSTYISSRQSANSLFHFMGKKDYLFNIIKNSALIPRFCKEDTAYLNIGLNCLHYPMICFCDINLHKVGSHMNTYGKYGIAFSKKWGITKGIQPIKYMNPNSPEFNDFAIAFETAMSMKESSPLKNYLLTTMFYMKPIQGVNISKNGEKEKNFTDECEWRYVAKTQDYGIKQVLVGKDGFSDNTFNTAITMQQKLWLHFKYSDIKYIIVNSQKDAQELISIIEELPISTKERHLLYTKIMIWKDLREDI